MSRLYNLYLFHGTDDESAKSIMKNGFDSSYCIDSDKHWLGKGLYFYREDCVQALIWALYKIKNNFKLNNTNPIVIEVNISVTEDKFLNLDTRIGLSRFAYYIESMKNSLKKDKIKVLQTNGNEHKYRCLIINNISTDEIYVVQRTFPVESKYDEDEDLKQMNINLHGVQVCVRNEKALNIENIKIVEEYENKTLVHKTRNNKKNKPKFLK